MVMHPCLPIRFGKFSLGDLNGEGDRCAAEGGHVFVLEGHVEDACEPVVAFLCWGAVIFGLGADVYEPDPRRRSHN